MIGRVSYIRKDRQLASKVFEEGARILEEHTDHAGYSCEVRYLFSFRGMTLRKNQEINRKVSEWATTVTASQIAHHDAGRIHFMRSKVWESFFEGKIEDGHHGLALIISCPGIGLSHAEGLHKLFCDMFDENLYVGFDMQLPMGIKGYPFTREFSC